MTIGIILAGGKGTRLQSQTVNKTSLSFHNKALVNYGVELFRNTTDKTIIVVGAFAQSVMENVAADPNVFFAHQEQQLGTGHAVVVAVETIKKLGFSPDTVLVGYGDHMMFYPKHIVTDVLALHEKKQAVVTLITTDTDKPDFLGRIVRDSTNDVKEIIEHKDATEEQRKITEINPGFYCFDYQFLLENCNKLEKSLVSGEYYINDFIHLATMQGKKVAALKVPFAYVGIGINTKEELEASQVLYKEVEDK